MIKENTEALLREIPQFNKYGERVTLVAAVKMQTPEAINEAISAGVTDIGDNHVQEFRDKFDLIEGNPVRHFIGHLQTNKVKYLIGKVDLYHSVDRPAVAEEISRRSEAAQITSDVLVQINIGDEQSKGGFALSEAEEACKSIGALPALRLRGLMAMLPLSDDSDYLTRLATLMREKFDSLRKIYANFDYLSMGMSGDWKLCLDCGSNMIRVGTAIFGARNYNK